MFEQISPIHSKSKIMSNRWKPSDCAKVVLSLEATQAKLKKSEKLKKLETKIQQQSESQFSQAKVILESIEKQVITLTLEKNRASSV
ncbi:MAG: hypothetical protein HC784_08475 [Hydrococcus sp. CSU_1_8]|nr:hypothetical protein [Hydrococcus sp. CSU_1_8]